MTPTQLKAFSAVVRHGSVKDAAAELGVTEAAVSLHVGQLRKELDDQRGIALQKAIAQSQRRFVSIVEKVGARLQRVFQDSVEFGHVQITLDQGWWILTNCIALLNHENGPARMRLEKVRGTHRHTTHGVTMGTAYFCATAMDDDVLFRRDHFALHRRALQFPLP